MTQSDSAVVNTDWTSLTKEWLIGTLKTAIVHRNCRVWTTRTKMIKLFEALRHIWYNYWSNRSIVLLLQHKQTKRVRNLQRNWIPCLLGIKLVSNRTKGFTMVYCFRRCSCLFLCCCFTLTDTTTLTAHLCLCLVTISLPDGLVLTRSSMLMRLDIRAHSTK